MPRIALSPKRKVPARGGSWRCIVISITALAGWTGLAATSLRAADAISQGPHAIAVLPSTVTLHGSRAKQQLLVSAVFADSEADFTSQASFRSAGPGVAQVTADGIVLPRGDGETEIVVTCAAREIRVPVAVRDFSALDPVEFRTDAVAALSRAGCNQGACHGSPQGKNGFRLSLRGYLPDLDLASLVRDFGGRRTNVQNPQESLILLKGASKIPHQGGTRFKEQDPAYRALLNWIAQGCRDTGRERKLVQLEVLPAARRLHTDHPRQQLVALAHFADGSTRDVSDLAVFSLNKDSTAHWNDADANLPGRIEFDGTGEASVLVRYLDRIVGSRLSYVRHDPEFVYSSPPEANLVDKLVFARQREQQLLPASLASDEVFLRRVYLDLIGELPSEAEAREFLASAAPDRRAKLIDALLERDEYASFWALKWADVMRGNRATISERGVHSFHRYLVEQFSQDRPWDEFARETLTTLGNTLYKPAANFHRVARTPEDSAEAAAQLFLGVRIGCARCHNHPFEMITQDDYYALAANFARVRFKGSQFGLDDEIVYLERSGELNHPVRNQPVPPAAFGQPTLETGPDDDRRQHLADWLTSPANRWFGASTVNRIWFHLLGRGIVDPVDDFRDTNPATNPDLLAALTHQFVRGGYRMRPVLRMILNSSTYQLSSLPPAQPSRYASDPERYFTHASVRLLSAEQILDALSTCTGIPEEFAGYPLGTRAIELAEGGIEHHFLQAFSKPVRDATCECAREEDPALGPVLHLVNNPSLISKVRSPDGRLAGWLRDGLETPAIVERLYLTALSRFPTADEQRIAQDYVSLSSDRTEGLCDLLHALLNSDEFLLRH